MSKKMAATKVLLQSILFYYVLSMKIFPCMGCIDSERKALTQFKQGLIDPAHRLASWKDSLDCCKWDGVSCNNQTGYVIQLDLRNPYADSSFSKNFYDLSLGGQVLDPALQQLEHLQLLDISGNSFSGIQIPNFLGSFQRLRYLNLSSAGFGGRVPQYIGNLSTLEVLDLSNNYVGLNSLSVDSLEWLGRMKSLKQLRMGEVNMTRVNGDWVQVIMSSLPSLRELLLSRCGISYIPQTIPLNNFTRLRVLDLSNNYLYSAVPKWVPNITSLESIDLRGNRFFGEIPSGFSQLPYLQELLLGGNSLLDNCSRVFIGKWESIKMVDLSNNHIYGGLPTYLGNLSKLEYLDLTGLLATKGIQNVLPDSICRLKNLRHLSLQKSNLVGSIPTCFGQLSSLEFLFLGQDKYMDSGGDNQFNETLREVHFEKLSKLQVLDLSSSGLKLNMKPDWVPPFQLLDISLQSCHFEGDHRFPRWLQNQKFVKYLHLSNTSISDTIPFWFWNIASNINIRRIQLSQNDIFGQVPNPLMIRTEEGLELDLSHNKLSGPIPSIHIIKGDYIIDLSDNKFTGPIPPNLVQYRGNYVVKFLASGNRINGTIPESLGKLKNLNNLDLSNNDLVGSIPSTFCDGQALYSLDLSENQLTGNIPLSMGNCSYLLGLNLKENHLIGSIPSTLGLLRNLESLHLSGNNLTEELPLSLSNCSRLTYIDLSRNKLVGSIPTWFSDSFPKLKVLSLRSNMFTGKIPPELSNLSSLQVLDLAQNFLHGPLPQTFQNFQAMRKKPEINTIMFITHYEENFVLTVNGQLYEYQTILLYQLVYINLSENLLSGEIPSELCNLYGLGLLNLSGNHFLGKIPQDIGSLNELRSLDLSRNQLSGQIPSSLSDLTFLQHLNLSHNRLHGIIPSGSQLQTLNDPSIYIGNPGLCGPPLVNNCTENKAPPSLVQEAQSAKEQQEMWWVYIGMGHGFIVGFCGFFGILVFKRGWRIAFFRFFDDMLEWIITIWVLNISWLLKQIRKEN